MVDLAPQLPTAKELVGRLAARGVQCLAFAERRLRLVTHLDVDRAACERAVEALTSIVRG
jgi:threonine aldolase